MISDGFLSVIGQGGIYLLPDKYLEQMPENQGNASCDTDEDQDLINVSDNELTSAFQTSVEGVVEEKEEAIMRSMLFSSSQVELNNVDLDIADQNGKVRGVRRVRVIHLAEKSILFSLRFFTLQ